MRNSSQEEGNFRFRRKIHSIYLTRDLVDLAKSGKREKFSWGEVIYSESGFSHLRLCISVRRSFSKRSSKRNRIKRVILEFFRVRKNFLKNVMIWVKVKKFESEEKILYDLQKKVTEIKFLKK